MPTFSGEDGLTEGAQGQPVPPPPEQPAFEPSYDGPSYTSSDVLPGTPPDGGRRARREAAAAAAAAAEHPAHEPVAGPSPLGRAILPAALALVSAVALAAAWMHLQTPEVDPEAVASPTTGASSPAPVSSSASPVASSTAPTSSPSLTPSSTPSSSSIPVVPVAPTSAPSATASTTRIDRSVPVVVLNGTTRTGLAARVAARLRADGWKVVSVANWRGGGVTRTSIFVNGEPDAAATMRKDLPLTREPIREPLSGMSRNKLVVVIGTDYPR